MRVQVGYTEDEWNAIRKYGKMDVDSYLDFALAVLAYSDDIWTQGWTSAGLADAIIDHALQHDARDGADR